MSINPQTGRPHVSKDPSRGYVEYDPYVELSHGKKVHGEHGIMDLRAEVARSAHEANMMDNQIIKDILKNK